MHSHDSINFASLNLPDLVSDIRAWGRELGFADIGISGIALDEAEHNLLEWLGKGFHGDMDYMAAHGSKRTRPGELLPGTLSVISARLPYWPADAASAGRVLADPALAYISRYALGRDYHKVLRDRLQKLASRIEASCIEKGIGPFQYRAFTDSAPVMEVALAAQTTLGWRGKHTLLLNREAGSYFFLGEIYVNLPLPPDNPASAHCGTCSACLDVCPTKAFVAPYILDARRCISYLTIEHKQSIPLELRPLMGNRIYGCDDCQLACPWNRDISASSQPDFMPRHGLDSSTLVELFSWDEETFLKRMEGSAIRRIGHERWLRNLAVAMGNAMRQLPPDSGMRQAIRSALGVRLNHASALVREHIAWALAQAA
jgi:epoxyqueuosine reductase